MRKTWFATGIAILAIWTIYAQNPDALPERNRIGLFYGFGGQSLEFIALDTQYQYEIRQFEAQYSYALLTGRFFDLSLLGNPQINISRYRREDSNVIEEQGAEWGFTAGIAPSIHDEDRNIGFYLLISSGPMYISGSPQRQAYGLNFASSFMVGAYIGLFERINLEFRSGFRHISNAAIRYPNAGLNNLVWSVGLSYALP